MVSVYLKIFVRAEPLKQKDLVGISTRSFCNNVNKGQTNYFTDSS